DRLRHPGVVEDAHTAVVGDVDVAVGRVRGYASYPACDDLRQVRAVWSNPVDDPGGGVGDVDVTRYLVDRHGRRRHLPARRPSAVDAREEVAVRGESIDASVDVVCDEHLVARLRDRDAPGVGGTAGGG